MDLLVRRKCNPDNATDQCTLFFYSLVASLLATFGVLQYLLAPRYPPFNSFLSIPWCLFAISFFSSATSKPATAACTAASFSIVQSPNSSTPLASLAGWPRGRQMLPPSSFLTSERRFCCCVRRQNLLHTTAESAWTRPISVQKVSRHGSFGVSDWPCTEFSGINNAKLPVLEPVTPSIWKK